MSRVALLATFLALLAAFAAAEPPGRAVFDAAGCRACHKIGERGGNAGPDLTLVGLRRSSDWLRRWLADPKAWKPDTEMPAFRLPSGDLEAVVQYLSGLKGADWAAPPWRRTAPGPEQGKVIFNRAGCVACHGPGGRGGHPNTNVPGNAIPALSTVASTYTEEELIRRIRFGRVPDKEDPAGVEPLVAMPAWGSVLADAELAAVAAYVKSLAASQPPSDW